MARPAKQGSRLLKKLKVFKERLMKDILGILEIWISCTEHIELKSTLLIFHLPDEVRERSHFLINRFANCNSALRMWSYRGLGLPRTGKTQFLKRSFPKKKRKEREETMTAHKASGRTMMRTALSTTIAIFLRGRQMTWRSATHTLRVLWETERFWLCLFVFSLKKNPPPNQELSLPSKNCDLPLTFSTISYAFAISNICLSSWISIFDILLLIFAS